MHYFYINFSLQCHAVDKTSTTYISLFPNYSDLKTKAVLTILSVIIAGQVVWPKLVLGRTLLCFSIFSPLCRLQIVVPSTCGCNWRTHIWVYNSTWGVQVENTYFLQVYNSTWGVQVEKIYSLQVYNSTWGCMLRTHFQISNSTWGCRLRTHI